MPQAEGLDGASCFGRADDALDERDLKRLWQRPPPARLRSPCGGSRRTPGAA
jgi:hypothetical protein